MIFFSSFFFLQNPQNSAFCVALQVHFDEESCGKTTDCCHLHTGLLENFKKSGIAIATGNVIKNKFW